jgi:hypothetical protein
MHRCCSSRVARSGLRRVPPATLSLIIAPVRGIAHPLTTKTGEATKTPPQAPPPRSDSTLLFRATNPELQLDASKARNWVWPAGVVLFFAAYYAYLYSVGDFLPARPPSKVSQPPDDVLKVCAHALPHPSRRGVQANAEQTAPALPPLFCLAYAYSLRKLHLWPF